MTDYGQKFVSIGIQILYHSVFLKKLISFLGFEPPYPVSSFLKVDTIGRYYFIEKIVGNEVKTGFCFASDL